MMRVKLDIEDDAVPDAEWLADLIGWDLSHLAGVQQHARCIALVIMVASQHAAAVAAGPLAWPSVEQLATWLRTPCHAHGWLANDAEIMRLLTVAVAAEWLTVFYDDSGRA